MKWFTSDWHLFHENIIKFAGRPWKDVEMMNNGILTIFDNTVKRGDELYFLGDFAFVTPENQKKVEEYLDYITNIVDLYVVYGNHDRSRMLQLYRKYSIRGGWLDYTKIDGKKVTLCHFPMTSFHASHWNAYQLYGHIHRDTSQEITGKRMNVTLEANNYSFVSWDDVVAYMDRQGNNWDYLTKTG